MGAVNPVFFLKPFQQIDRDDFLTKGDTIEFKHQGVNCQLVYHKDKNLQKIWIEKIVSPSPLGTSSLLKLENNVFKITDLPKEIYQQNDEISKVMTQILEKESKMVLGLTHLGEMDPHLRYKELTANNIDDFSNSLNIENYQTWAELEKWMQGHVDWKDVIQPRFQLVEDSPMGKIHFNLTGMTKENIEKSLKLEYRVSTGETEKTWGTKAPPMRGSWKEAFGEYGITYWELMQVVHSNKLLDKTTFYYYDSKRSAKLFELSPAVLKLDFGLDLEKIK